MATVIEFTAVISAAFSAVLQVTEDDTVEISADRVTTTVASGKEVTMEITAIIKSLLSILQVNTYML